MRRGLSVLAGGCVLALLLTGCAGLRTERQGRDVGRAVCKVKQADSSSAALSALDDLNRHLADAQRTVGRPVDQDVNNIQRNLNDLVRHVSDGNRALASQDVAAIRRSVSDAVDTASGLAKRFYQGVSEGLGDCV